MSKVIILGAGSSKECGLPLGDEIWSFLSHNSGPRWYDFLRDIFSQFTKGYIDKNGKIISIDKYPAFELVLTLIESHITNKQNLGDYSSSGLKEVKNSLIDSYRTVFYKKCLYANCQLEDPTPEAKEVSDNFNKWYQPFFKKQIKEASNDIVFISINYDVLIDLVLHNMIDNNEIQGFTYGFDEDIYNLYEQDKKWETGEILLLKPHGSLNFGQCPECKQIYVSRIFVEEENNPIREEVYNIYKIPKIPDDTIYKCQKCNKALKTLILPPIFDKPDKEQPFAILNKKVSEVISKATEILIIGYALPDYDLNILKAFLDGAIKNKNRHGLDIKVIDKVDSHKDTQTKHKYGKIFHQIAKGNYYTEGFKKYAEEFLGL